MKTTNSQLKTAKPQCCQDRCLPEGLTLSYRHAQKGNAVMATGPEFGMLAASMCREDWVEVATVRLSLFPASRNPATPAFPDLTACANFAYHIHMRRAKTRERLTALGLKARWDHS